MTKTIEEILAPKPEARLRLYAYSIDDEAHKGLLKVGQTTRNVKQRIAEQLKTAAIKNYCIELDEPADLTDGSSFADHGDHERRLSHAFGTGKRLPSHHHQSLPLPIGHTVPGAVHKRVYRRANL